ncbi:unnamed protein product [Amoebophrya sp. A25]|nr:unnamed protein product [Amoebophrya sp. A25]|eukprot:GSA25T00013916001.1
MAEFLDAETRRLAQESERQGGKVFVGNIKKDVEKDEISDVFEKFGEILSIWVAKQPPGFCFVTYRDPEDAKKAVQEVNGTEASFVEDNGKGLRVERSTYAEKKWDRRRRERDDSRGRGRSPPRGRRDDSRRRGGRRDSRERGRDRRGGGRERDSRRRRR